ncbi:hypothetical protein P1X15_21630 [Runella sp. MFBS21]|uniref:hypothetical protein n=1 Tax=Runella sp. MFBS21 TaxID=3034018 RepID=UPI0023F79AED|nr:hypothetical protein [Runella sp. MFBS21]MDF7820236.1 hypothetical protein [Runella sp. MFBS21]
MHRQTRDDDGFIEPRSTDEVSHGILSQPSLFDFSVGRGFESRLGESHVTQLGRVTVSVEEGHFVKNRSPDSIKAKNTSVGVLKFNTNLRFTQSLKASRYRTRRLYLFLKGHFWWLKQRVSCLKSQKQTSNTVAK